MNIKKNNSKIRCTIILIFIYSCQTYSNYPEHTSKEGINDAIYYEKKDIRTVNIEKEIKWQKHPTDFDEDDPEISNSIQEDLYNKTGNIIGYISERYPFRLPWYLNWLPLYDVRDKETYSDGKGKIMPISPFYYIVQVENIFIFVKKAAYESITQIENERSQLKELRVYLKEQKKDEPSLTILKKYSNFQKYEMYDKIDKGIKIQIDLLHFDELKVGGTTISKANSFQFNAKSIYSNIPPTKDLPRFYIYGQSKSIVSLFSHYNRFNDFDRISVYGTTMNSGSNPIVLADFIFFSSPPFGEIILKCENKDIDIRDFIK